MNYVCFYCLNTIFWTFSFALFSAMSIEMVVARLSSLDNRKGEKLHVKKSLKRMSLVQ